MTALPDLELFSTVKLFCNSDHLWTDENTVFRTFDKQRQCRECKRTSGRKYAASDKGKCSQRRFSTSPKGRAYRSRRPTKRYHLWSNYRMTQGQYRGLLETQGGVCVACKRTSKDGKALHVDHDHSCCPKTPTCGKCNRGLLCDNCNRAVGLCGDSPDVLRILAEYLEHHRERLNTSNNS